MQDCDIKLYEDLGNRIVASALHDLIQAGKTLENPKSNHIRRRAAIMALKDTTAFFSSGFYSILCDIDPEDLIAAYKKKEGKKVTWGNSLDL